MATTRIVIASFPENLKRTVSMVSVMDQNSPPAPAPRKRQRLTHLTPEEKMLRRKLKNRVAAQTARDRKKAHVDTVEDALEITQLSNQELHKQNKDLKQQNERLMKENQELRRRLSLDTYSQVETDDVVVIKKEVESPESAALKAPPQQAQIQLISTWLTTLLCFSLMCYWDCLITWTPKSLTRAVPKEKMTPLRPSQPKTILSQWWGPQQKSWNPSKN